MRMHNNFIYCPMLENSSKHASLQAVLECGLKEQLLLLFGCCHACIKHVCLCSSYIVLAVGTAWFVEKCGGLWHVRAWKRVLNLS